MITKQGERPVKVNQNMRGGNGSVIIEGLLGKDEMYDKGRLYARITLGPGCSVGSHVHEGEMESFYMLTGTATYDDNGTTVTLEPGDVTFTADGQSHSVANNGTEDVVMLALILYSVPYEER
jgi:quercetin dioxygenase-like cupin family protein